MTPKPNPQSDDETHSNASTISDKYARMKSLIKSGIIAVVSSVAFLWSGWTFIIWLFYSADDTGADNDAVVVMSGGGRSLPGLGGKIGNVWDAKAN